MTNDREEVRRGLLARLASLFASALELEPTVRGVVDVFVPEFAEWCSVDLLRDGQLHRVASAAVDAPGWEQAVERLRGDIPAGEVTGMFHQIMQGERPLVVHIDDLASSPFPFRDAGHAALLASALPISLLFAPLRAHGETLGVLQIGGAWGRRHYTPGDADLVADVAQRAALAIHNATLFGRLQVELVARAEATRQLQSSELRYRHLFEESPVALWVYDVETLRFLAVNDAAVAQYGFTREELHAMTIREIRPPDAQALLDRVLREIKPGMQHSGQFTHRRKDGSLLFADIRSHDIEFDGRHARLIHAQDVTERVQAFEALRLAEERHRLVSRATKEAIWELDPRTGVMQWNPAFHELFRFETSLAETTRAWYEERIHPDDRARAIDDLASAIAHRHEMCPRHYRLRRGDEAYVYVNDRAIIAYNREAPARIIGSITDVTLQRQLGEQLAVAQRMEAVGRLAGGLAHDFNNLLTAIRGFTTFVLDEQPRGSSTRDDLDQILQAVDRAAALTRQLLAFSRRQVMQPQLIDINGQLQSLERLVGRLLGEDIELQTFIQADVWPVLVDPAQFEQVIMNLVVNARDAMPSGGLLTIESSNVVLDEAYARTHLDASPGPHVMVAVTDTGVGMDPSTMARVFEPFFSTKERDKGTGLGLATSYGIVRQSGGHIWVYSEPGRGSTFKVYLPRAAGGEADVTVHRVTPVSSMEGTETILLVEDDERVRRVSTAALRRYGYHVLEAAAAEQALRLFTEHEAGVALVVTDVVLPRMSGPQLARLLQARHPGLRVLYVSGYTENAIVHHGRLDPGVELLEKPFGPEVLARRVREILDRP